MTAPGNLILSRSTYSLKDVAKFAGLDVDDLLETHVREGDLDLYVKVPAGSSVYALIRDYLGMKSPSVVMYPHLVGPKKHAEIEALRLSHKDCIALAKFRKIEQSCFPAGLAAKSSEAPQADVQDEFDQVLLRDWNFYPGQFEALDFQFGYGERLSEQSLDAIRKGATFRLNSEHVEGGGPSDFSLLGRAGGRLPQSYAYWFGLYPDPPAPGPVVDKRTGITPPEKVFISEADVFVTRADVRNFLERFPRPIEDHDVVVANQKEIVEKLEGLVQQHDVLLGSLTAIAGKHEALVDSGGAVIGKHDALVGNLGALTEKQEALVDSGESIAQKHDGLVVNLEAIAGKHDALLGSGGAVVQKHDVLLSTLEAFTEKHGALIERGESVFKKHEALVGDLGSLATKHEAKEPTAFSVPDGFPPLCASYSFPDALQKSEKGYIRAVPRKDSPKMLEILFSTREAKWAFDWKKNMELGFDEADDTNEAVITILEATATESGLELSEKDAREMSYFVRPVWARREEDPQVRDDWSGTYETPEFMRLVSAASRLQDEKAERVSDHVNDEIDAILTIADPVSISGKKLRLARMVVRYAPGKPGKPSGVPSGEKSK